MRFDTTELDVCSVCYYVMAYGEYDDGTNIAEEKAEAWKEKFADDAQYLTPGGEDLGFLNSGCDACWEHESGVRVRAYLMVPEEDTTWGPYENADTAREAFDDFMDEVFQGLHVGNLYFSVSKILRECDPVAYRYEFNNWIDNEITEWKESN